MQVTEILAQLHDAEAKLKTVTEKLALLQAEAAAAVGVSLENIYIYS